MEWKKLGSDIYIWHRGHFLALSSRLYALHIHVDISLHSISSTTRSNPFMPNGLFYLSSSDRSISNIRGVKFGFFLLPCFIEIPVFNANIVDPDLTPRSAASDLGLQYLLLSLSLLRDARQKMGYSFSQNYIHNM